MVLPPRRRVTWSLVRKKNALDLVAEIGVKPAARQLNIHINSIQRWRKSEAQIRFALTVPGRSPSASHLGSSGRKSSISPEHAQHLVDYVLQNRILENKVTVEMLVSQLRLLDESLIVVRRDIIRRRIWRILRNNRIALRRTTHKAQQNTRLLQTVIDDWIDYLKKKLLG